MVEEKGLPEEIANKIGKYVLLNGGVEMLKSLLEDATLTANARAKEGLGELSTLFEYLEVFSVMKNVFYFIDIKKIAIFKAVILGFI